MGFNPPVPQKDSDWEIRVAVLLSLLLQVLLIFVGPVRKRSSSPVPRFAVWSCYLLADWVADLALGLLLNNMGNIGGSSSSSSSISHASGLKRGGGGGIAGNSSGGSPIIFAFWTPFLLLHLGGPDTITAYSLEDNELWLRHLIGLLFELFSASVIFFCSLQGNYMIPATVLMFVVGIIKYGERTYSLYSGSVNGFRESILDDPDPGPNYAKLMTEFDAKEKAGLVVEIVIADGEAKKAQDALEHDETVQLVTTSNKSLEARAYEFFLDFRRLFVNLILSYKERKISQAYFLERDDMTPTMAFQVIEVELNFIYDMVYTKAPVAHRKAGWFLRFVGSGCIVSALVIFFLLDKSGNGISRVDVGITYALLLGGLALDAAALAMLFFSNRMLVFLEETPRLEWLAPAVKLLRALRPPQRRWSEKTSQLNLISYCLLKPDGNDQGGHCCSTRCCASPRMISALAKVAETLRVREIFDDFFFIRREPLRSRKGEEPRLLKFIFDRLKGAAKEVEEPLLLKFIFDRLKGAAKKAKDYKDMKETCNYRGLGVLEHDEDLHMRIKQRLMEVLVHDKDLHMRIKQRLMEVTKGGQPDLDEAEIEKKAEEKLKDVLVDSVDKKAEEKLKDVLHDEDLHKEIKLRLEEKFHVLVDSVDKREFDESLLLWHIATDLCDLPLPEHSAPNKYKPIGKTLSEYMLYLLIKQPEMLSATAGIGLLRYRDTCAEARRFFKSAAAWDPDHADARRMLLSVNTSKKPSEVKGDRSKSVLFDAVILAKVLGELDNELMWEVVAGVWREMLTYAAGKCRGSTHVRQLSRGGELITIVWFLMAHMGIGDMYQIQEGDAKAKLIVHDQ